MTQKMVIGKNVLIYCEHYKLRLKEKQHPLSG